MTVHTEKKTNWNWKNVLHLRRSTTGSSISVHKLLLCLTIHLMQCRGFVKLEAAQNVDDVRMSFSTTRKYYPNFETLDAKIATALKRILKNTNFMKKVYFEEQKSPTYDRQSGRMICEHFRIAGTNETLQEISDLMNITLRGDDVQGFGTKWDEVLLSMREASQG